MSKADERILGIDDSGLNNYFEYFSAFANFNIRMAEKFNPHHVPAGTPEGGQFTTAAGTGATTFLPRNEKVATGLASNLGTRKEIAAGVNTNYKYTTEDGEEFFVKEIFLEERPGSKFSPEERGKEREREILARQVTEAVGAETVLDVKDVTYQKDSLAVATEWVEGKNWHQRDFADNVTHLENLPSDQFTDVVVSEMLIANWDRHDGNVMVTNDGRLLLIDNGRSFSSDGPGNMVDVDVVSGGAITQLVFSESFADRQLDIQVLSRASSPAARTRVRNIADSSSVLDFSENKFLIARHDFLAEAAALGREQGSLTVGEFVDLALVEKMEQKFNPHHEPAGAPGGIGGRFAESPSGAGTPQELPIIRDIPRTTATAFEKWKKLELSQMHSQLIDDDNQGVLNVGEQDSLNTYVRNDHESINGLARDDTEAIETYVIESVLGADKGFLDAEPDNFESATGVSFEEFEARVQFAMDDAQTNIDNLDSAIADSSFGRSVVTYRGLNIDHFSDTEFGNQQELVDSLSTELVGGTISDDGFLSTSLDLDTAISFARTKARSGGSVGILEIRVPEGQNALYVDNHLGIWEYEVILPRGAELKIVGVEFLPTEKRLVEFSDGGVPKIIVEVVQ